jgi:hypothetical protein
MRKLLLIGLLLPLAACVASEGVLNIDNECTVIETGATFILRKGTKIHVLETIGRGVLSSFVDEQGWNWTLDQSQFKCRAI